MTTRHLDDVEGFPLDPADFARLTRDDFPDMSEALADLADTFEKLQHDPALDNLLANVESDLAPLFDDMPDLTDESVLAELFDDMPELPSESEPAALFDDPYPRPTTHQ